MGYSKNVSTLRNMQSQLALLIQLKPCRWERPGKDADRWAYKIREALSLAERITRKNAGDAEDWIVTLASARKMFEIRVISETLVEASFKTDAEVALQPTPVVQGMAPAGRAHTLGEVKSLEDMMSVWSLAQPTNDPIHFPECLLSDSDLMLAADWASALRPPWMLLRPRGTNSVTLAPHDSRVPSEARIKGMRPDRPRAARNDAEDFKFIADSNDPVKG